MHAYAYVYAVSHVQREKTLIPLNQIFLWEPYEVNKEIEIYYAVGR